jgi:superfamily I DNA/RNA helicase
VTVSRRRVARSEWEPIGVTALEDNALVVVRSEDNRSVIAGPGAGKTELLAQRAAYLLQTGASPHPRRILAISFKRDAASNLAARVRQRCHPDLGHRLESMTFDAFAKNLVERFIQALPDHWRPTTNYQIDFPKSTAYGDFLNSLGSPPADVGTRAEPQEIVPRDFERQLLFGEPLRQEWSVQPEVEEWAVKEYWRSSLRAKGGSRLSFQMIGRLAELIVRMNPALQRAVALTYSHVFLDEFQDTTHIQYALTRTMFRGSDTILTAVGDNKQQIMRWAMAMSDPFAALERDFSAVRTQLVRNYRSSPTLVKIQHVVARAIDAKSVEAISMAAQQLATDSCEIWDFDNSKSEAATVAQFIAAEIAARSLRPRDFVLLVRQKADEFMSVLEPAFLAAGLQLRNEAANIGPVRLQELLAEELSEVVVCVLRLATTNRAGRLWTDAVDTLAGLEGVTADPLGCARVARRLERMTNAVAAEFPSPPQDEQAAAALVRRVIEFVGVDLLKAAFPAYRQGDWVERVSEAIALHLANSSHGQSSWADALEVYEGSQAVPLMTIHKSKGLEYHTVAFLGLDDRAWWSFARDQAEATAGFFVAFTRAKQRVLFTYCSSRGIRREIQPLYELLRRAGVPTIQK